MTTEQERIVRWRLIAGVLVAAIAAGLAAYGVITGAQWVQTVVGVFAP